MGKRDHKILIPAYNSERYLDDLFDRLERSGHLQDTVVVNDGSSDSTGDVCIRRGVEVVSLKRNSGKGAALKKGFKYMVENGVDFFITIDSDLQHDTKYISDFIEEYEKNKWDIIIGDRLGDTSTMPVERIFSNRTTSFIISLIAGTKIPDSQSGYRLIRTEVVKNLVLTTDKFDTESELLIKAGRKGYRIGSIKISALYEGAHSSISVIRDTYRFIRLVIRSLFIKN